MKDILSLKDEMEFQSTLQLHMTVIVPTTDGTPEEAGEEGERN